MNTTSRFVARVLTAGVSAGLAASVTADGLPNDLTGVSVDMGSFNGTTSLFVETIDDSADWVAGWGADELFGSSQVDAFMGVGLDSLYEARIEPGQLEQPVHTAHASMTGQLTQGSAVTPTDISGGASTQTVFKPQPPLQGEDLDVQIEFFGNAEFRGPAGGSLSQGSIFAGGTTQIGMLDGDGNFNQISSQDWFLSWDGINPPMTSGILEPTDVSPLPEANGYAIDFSHTFNLPVDASNTYSVRSSSFAFTGVNGPLMTDEPFTFQTTGQGFGNTITMRDTLGGFLLFGRRSTNPDACSPADLAEPFGTLDVSDIFVFFIEFFALGDARADFVPDGTLDLIDIIAFFAAFAEGC